MPREKYEKAYVAMATSCGAGCPASLSVAMDPYVKCASWTMYDYDSVCLSSVTLKKSIEEAVLNNTVSVPASEIPSGSTVLMRYKKRVQVMPAIGNAESDMELGPLVQLLMISKKMQYEQALEMAKDHVGKRRATATAGSTASSSSSSPFQDADYADVVVTRVVGPLAVGARFDYMIYNSLLKEGVLYRKAPQTTTSSAAAVETASSRTGGSCYTLSFDADKYGVDKLPKLIAHTDRVKLPGEVASGGSGDACR